jgi:hypothetical protein
MPQDQQQFARLALGMLDRMQATLTLGDDGDVALTLTFDGRDDDVKKGTWRQEGTDVLLTSDGKDMRCTPGGTRLVCAEAKNTMVFTRR